MVIFRQIGGKKMGAVFDLKAIRGGKAEDPMIYGDDIVVIEQSGSKTALRHFIESVPDQHRRLKNSELVRFPARTHFGILEGIDEMAEIITRSFLNHPA